MKILLPGYWKHWPPGIPIVTVNHLMPLTSGISTAKKGGLYQEGSLYNCFTELFITGSWPVFFTYHFLQGRVNCGVIFKKLAGLIPTIHLPEISHKERDHLLGNRINTWMKLLRKLVS